MKVSELTKQAADLVQKRNAEDQAIKDREAAAVARLTELKAQAEHLAHERKFDEYAENMEDQRKQNDIINLVKQINRRTPEQKATDDATISAFHRQAQNVFDEDTVKDFRDLEEILKKADAVASRIDKKYEDTNKAVQDVARACQSAIVYGSIAAPMTIPGTVHDLLRQYAEMRKQQEKAGKLLW